MPNKIISASSLLFFPRPLGSIGKCVVIVSAPLTYLNCVCLGWRKVSCWDFNLLTEPSVAVVGSHISGIKSKAVQHVTRSSCALHTLNLHTLWHTHLSSHSEEKKKRHFQSNKYCRCTHMSKCTHVQQCKSGKCGPPPLSLLLRLPSDSPLPAAQGPDYHFITACHYSDAINGNELADNWFTITLPSSTRALREPLVLIDSFLLSALSDWL